MGLFAKKQPSVVSEYLNTPYAKRLKKEWDSEKDARAQKRKAAKEAAEAKAAAERQKRREERAAEQRRKEEERADIAAERAREASLRQSEVERSREFNTGNLWLDLAGTVLMGTAAVIAGNENGSSNPRHDERLSVENAEKVFLEMEEALGRWHINWKHYPTLCRLFRTFDMNVEYEEDFDIDKDFDKVLERSAKGIDIFGHQLERVMLQAPKLRKLYEDGAGSIWSW